MQYFKTPVGRAGTDQLSAMEESIQFQLEQMFFQLAKKNALENGVGRSARASGSADDNMRLDAQRRECDGCIAFHAGRALELAFHVLYARGADRIIGREYPGTSESESKRIKGERRGHSLFDLYCRITAELSDRSISEALDDVYQRALHRGVVDIRVDDKKLGSLFITEDVPFRETTIARMMDGAEMTLDHLKDHGDLIVPTESTSDFSKMPYKTFVEFLQKADSVYYETDISDKSGNTHRKDMRWSHYSARDHEYGRTYVTVGTEFFARLVKGVVGLSNQAWTWHEDFAQRQIVRRQYNIEQIVKTHLMQNFDGEVNLPEMISVDKALTALREHRHHRPTPDHILNSFHTDWSFNSVESSDESAIE